MFFPPSSIEFCSVGVQADIVVQAHAHLRWALHKSTQRQRLTPIAYFIAKCHG